MRTHTDTHARGADGAAGRSTPIGFVGGREDGEEIGVQKTIEVTGRVWDSLPDYFLELRKENAAATNALEHYLQHGRLEYHPDYLMTQTEFQRRFVAISTSTTGTMASMTPYGHTVR